MLLCTIARYCSGEEKAFLESASWAGVLEQTLEHTLNPKTETDCLFSPKLNETIFCTKSRLTSTENRQGLHIIHSTTSQRNRGFGDLVILG